MGTPLWLPCRELAYRLQMFVPWGMVAYSGSWRFAGQLLPASNMSEEDGASWFRRKHITR